MDSLLFPHPSSSSLALTSDDDDHPSATPASAANPKKSSSWHRMKWTDDVVRLLISLVSFVGDDINPADPKKKGKWKTVSTLMLDKGLYVSPQQCEDKFNDLNKRYKRLNEILGRGTTCQVVENPSLLDSMPQVSAKAKEDVRKILSSKHLFYREMCAYHNGQRIPNTSRDLGTKTDTGDQDDHDHYHGHGHCHGQGHDHDQILRDSDNEDDDSDEEAFGRVGAERLEMEIDGLSPGQKKDWLRKRTLLLMEEKAEIEAEGLELAKRRVKWLKFKSKKDWEMEKAWVENERLMLENERMAMQIRQKEIEMDGEQGRVQ